LNELLFDAEEALLGVHAQKPATPEPQLTLDVEEVAGALRTLRHAVGV
jgi:hypothetical protein